MLYSSQKPSNKNGDIEQNHSQKKELYIAKKGLF